MSDAIFDNFDDLQAGRAYRAFFDTQSGTVRLAAETAIGRPFLLRGDQLRIVRAAYRLGFTNKKIAAFLGVSREAVDSALGTARHNPNGRP